jgi:hypothetical protein
MSRFVVLSRRLEAQMLEMDGNPDGHGSRSDTPLQNASASGSTRDAMQSTVGEHEDEKERTIAKAALSIAELGIVFCYFCTQALMPLFRSGFT